MVLVIATIMLLVLPSDLIFGNSSSFPVYTAPSLIYSKSDRTEMMPSKDGNCSSFCLVVWPTLDVSSDSLDS